MTAEEAIKEFKERIEFGKKEYLKYIPEYVEALEMAIEALEKQIAKKPDFEGDGYDCSGNLVYDTWICPNCEADYEVDYEEYECCPKCGQAIDWGE